MFYEGMWASRCTSEGIAKLLQTKYQRSLLRAHLECICRDFFLRRIVQISLFSKAFLLTCLLFVNQKTHLSNKLNFIDLRGR